MSALKHGVLVSSTQQSGTTDGYKNIGDYIQSLAQIQFCGTDPLVYVDKETISEFEGNGDNVKVILNAWWMVFPQYWPPSEDIIPLLLSMHISPSKSDEFLSEAGVNYLQKFGPVGCRDRGTEQILKARGVASYYSGCLTLTLGLRYKNKKTTEKVIFVDPYIESVRDSAGRFSATLALGNLIFGISRFSKIARLYDRFTHFYCISGKYKALRKFICVAAFYRAYRSRFSEDLIFGAKYVTHSIQIGNGTNYDTEEKKINLAEQLIVDYSDAALIITSRIHCALPCLGLGTRVIFTHSEGVGHVRDPGRFGGVVELFNILEYNNFNFISSNESLPKKIDRNSLASIVNKDSHLPLIESMVEKCTRFFQNI